MSKSGLLESFPFFTYFVWVVSSTVVEAVCSTVCIDISFCLIMLFRFVMLCVCIYVRILCQSAYCFFGLVYTGSLYIGE